MRFVSIGLLILTFLSIPWFVSADSTSAIIEQSAPGTIDTAFNSPKNDSANVTTLQLCLGKKIIAISVRGNRTTKEKTVRLFLQSIEIDIGTDYDSAKISYAKQKLRLTNLYSKVDIVPVPLENGVHVYIIVSEVFYLSFDGLGAGWERRRYGQDINWYRFNFGLTQNNFRGRMETFSLGSTIWDDRAISLSWTKPFYPSKYYISLSAASGHYQDFNFPQNLNVLYGRIGVGRRLTLHSQGGFGLAPTHTSVDSLTGKTITAFRELISSVRYSFDFRNDVYDTHHGWYFGAVVSTNSLYSDEIHKYVQLFTDGKWYASIPFKGHRFAFHTQSYFRTRDAGNFKRLYLGGDASVRGFPNSWMGVEDTMNNLASISSEYRFPLFTTPVIGLGFLSEKYEELRGLFYEVEGALIADAGYLWHDFPRFFDRRQNGAGIGAGVNVKIPVLRAVGTIDAVWPITKQTDPAKPYYNRTIIYSFPTWHVFVSNF